MASRIVRCAWSSKPASVCLALWFAVGVTTQRTAAASDPQQVAQDFYAVLLSTMRDGRSLGQNGRYARLAPVVNRTFDLAFMARLAVGPSWATLAPSEQQRLTDAFGNYISATYADRFNTYSGEQLKVTDERPYGSAVMVETKIVKSNGDNSHLSDAPQPGSLANLGRVPRRYNQPVGSATFGVQRDSSARGGGWLGHGAKPQGRSAAEHSPVVVACRLTTN